MTMNLKSNQKNRNRKILIAFWSVVVFSFGFYLIYYYQCKKRILKIRKNIETKLFHLKNIIIAINHEILINYGIKTLNDDNLIHLNIKVELLDYSPFFYKVINHINSQNSFTNEEISTLLIRLSNIQKNTNYLIKYFNIYSYEFPYQYVFLKNNWNKINLIEPIIDQKNLKMQRY